MVKSTLCKSYRAFLDKVIGDSQSKEDIILISEHLQDLYEMPPRAYHNEVHILEGLKRIKFSEQEAQPLYFAWYYHDSFYRPGDPRNEKKSSELLWIHMRALNLSDKLIEEACNLIEYTKHDPLNPPKKFFERLIADIDLIPLADAREKFNKSSRDIRNEFAHISDREFFKGRLKFLIWMLDRKEIYRTKECQDLYETKARKNISLEADRCLDILN